MDSATSTAQCWGGPWCGRELTVADGRKVVPLDAHGGEYLLMLRTDRRGTVLHSEWTWWERFNVVQRKAKGGKAGG